MNIIAYLTVNLLLFFSWYTFLFRSKNHLSFIDRVLGAIILGLSQIILTEMVLGILFKKLYAAPLFVLNSLISLSVLSLAFAIEKINYRDVLGEIEDKASRLLNIIKTDLIFLILSVLFILYCCYLILIGYLFPSYTWDALLYHLPIMGYILQSGAIEKLPDYSLIYVFLNIFPKNIELFFLWNVIFLKSAVIVDLSQMFFALTGMLSIYSIAVKLGIKDRYAVYSSLLFFFAPVIILQSTMEYVDIAVSVLFLTAINFLMFIGQEAVDKKHVPVLLSGLSAGILLGAKGSGPVFILVVLVMIIIHGVVRYSKISLNRCLPPTVPVPVPKLRDWAGYLLYFIVPVILLGSYWYIQNYVHYNNPVYPFEVRLFGRVLFAGIFTEILDDIPHAIQNLSPAASLLYVWLEREGNYIYYSYLSGFGPIWFILFLPSTGFSVFYAIRKKRYDFLLTSLIVILIFIVSTRNWNPRYVIFILGLGSLSFALMLNYLEGKGKVLRLFALILAVYTLFVSNSPCITPGKIKEFIKLPAKERTLTKMDTSCLLSERSNYGMWAWTNANVSESSTLAYTFHPILLAPLWNSNLSNKIVYVKGRNLFDWQKNLGENNTDYVLIMRKSIENWWLMGAEKFRHIPAWAAALDKLKVVYADKEYLILKPVSE